MSDSSESSEDDYDREPYSKRKRFREDSMPSDNSDIEGNFKSSRSLRYRAVKFQNSTSLLDQDEIDEKLTHYKNQMETKESLQDDKTEHSNSFKSSKDNISEFLNPDNCVNMRQSPAERRNLNMLSEQFGLGAELLSKMGYQVGLGLGADRQGIIDPVQVKQRPERVGLGALSEAGKKAEKFKEQQRLVKAVNRPKSSMSKLQPKQSAQELISEAKRAFELPNTILRLLDMTGEQTKQIELAIGSNQIRKTDSKLSEHDQLLKLSMHAQKDIQSSLEEWNSLQNRKNFLEKEKGRISSTKNTIIKGIEDLEKIQHDLNLLSENNVVYFSTMLQDLATNYEMLHSTFNLNGKYRELVSVNEITAAALTPLLAGFTGKYIKYEDVTNLTLILQKMQPLNAPEKGFDLHSKFKNSERTEHVCRPATPIENIFYNLWLPEVRSQLHNNWLEVRSISGIKLWDFWKDSIPTVMKRLLTRRLILPRLQEELRSEIKEDSDKKDFNKWLFPWFSRLEPSDSYELLVGLRDKFTSLLRSWNTSDKYIRNMNDWNMILGSEDIQKLTDSIIIPKLKRALRLDFKVDPSDQKMEVIDSISFWSHYADFDATIKLIADEFFPKWHNILFLWLTNEPDYENISLWYKWWRDVFPIRITESEVIKGNFKSGLDMINQALDLGSEASLKLIAPSIVSSAPMKQRQAFIREKRFHENIRLNDIDHISFKELIHEFCVQNELLLTPLHTANPISGEPLYKISKAEAPKRSLQAYFQDDILWLQDGPGIKTFSPSSLENLKERF